MHKKVLGICGNKYHGKDTVVNLIRDYLVSQGVYKDTEIQHFKFANRLKRSCKLLFSFTDDQIDGQSKDKPDMRYDRKENQDRHDAFIAALSSVTNVDKRTLTSILDEYSDIVSSRGPRFLTPRYAMENLGTNFGRWMCRSLWLQIIKNNIEALPDRSLVLISDVRFPNEAEFIWEELNGMIWKVDRSKITPPDLSVDSEKFIPEIKCDRLLDNNRDMLHLASQVHDFIKYVVNPKDLPSSFFLEPTEDLPTLY